MNLRRAAPAILRRLVQHGHFGRKTKLGFYDYASEPPKANEELWRLVHGGAFRDEGPAEDSAHAA